MTPTEKRGPGRPPESSTGERRIKAPINMAPSVLVEAKRQAAARGLSLSGYIEVLILGAAARSALVVGRP